MNELTSLHICNLSHRQISKHFFCNLGLISNEVYLQLKQNKIISRLVCKQNSILPKFNMQCSAVIGQAHIYFLESLGLDHFEKFLPFIFF